MERSNHIVSLYQVLILETSNEYKNDCWLAYDRCFRQQAASDPQCKWSNINSTFWNLAFTGQARASRCRHCFSLFHSSRDCELASDQATTTPEPQFRRPFRSTQRHCRLVCYQWNEQRAQNCSYPNCRFEHVCYYCTFDPEARDINHKAIYCPNRTNHSQQPTAPRQPLFPCMTFEAMPLHSEVVTCATPVIIVFLFVVAYLLSLYMLANLYKFCQVYHAL